MKRTVPAAKDPDIDPDPDDQHLPKLLGALQDNDRSLGELRRNFDLAPELVLRLMNRHPDLLSECPTTERISLRPAAQVAHEAPELPPEAFLERVPSNPPSSESEQPSASLIRDKEKLLCVMGGVARYSPYIEDQGLSFETVKAIAAAWPDLLTISPCALGQRFAWYVSLRSSESNTSDVPKVEDGPTPPEGRFLTVAEQLSPGELALMRWKPNRNSGRSTNALAHTHRQRTPLVKI